MPTAGDSVSEIWLLLYLFNISFIIDSTDTTQPLSEVYGVPVPTAVKLMRTLCQAGRNMAALLVSTDI